jgi:signal recognition particle receptor subunit beta
MADYKVLFTGSVCSGKTTAIRSLSDIETVDTDTNVSDSAIRRKRKTTIAMDYGVLELSDESRLHLYGTPGQERFKFMWELMMSDLVHDAEGLVLLVDNTRADPFKDIQFYIQEFRDFIVRRRLIIAVTHSDEQADPDYHFYMNKIKEMGLFTTVMFIDARDPESVLTVIKELLETREREIDWSGLAERLQGNSSMPGTENEEQQPPKQDVSLMDAALNTRGITGAIHLDSDRNAVSSQIDDAHSREILKAMVNLVSALEKKAGFLGHIEDLILCGRDQETLAVFMDDDQALGLCADPELSINVVKQQAADLLQWSKE